MLNFYKHTKFWLPIIIFLVLVLFLEILLRLGVWDNYIKPHSYLGNVIYRKQALNEFGLEKIEWITIGDSRTDWGLNHNQILIAQNENGINHLRLSFESSNFMAIQATIDWSIANMPNLKGIMLGLAEENFGHHSDVVKQFKVSWPFREYYDYSKYHYFNQDILGLRLIIQNAIFVYYPEFV